MGWVLRSAWASIAVAGPLLQAACDSDNPAPADTAADTGEPAPRTCLPPSGVSARPDSIAAAVALINALPKPTSLPCFLEALERPIAVNASASDFSAQPAQGERSPRIFLFEGPLIMSVVPDGPSPNRLEFGEQLDARMSVKGELAFPIEEELPGSAPFDEIDAGTTSLCVQCHGEERAYPEIGFDTAFVSDVLQPDPELDLPVAFVKQFEKDCDPAAEPVRCAMLSSILAHGEVLPAAFPDQAKFCLAP